MLIYLTLQSRRQFRQQPALVIDLDPQRRNGSVWIFAALDRVRRYLLRRIGKVVDLIGQRLDPHQLGRLKRTREVGGAIEPRPNVCRGAPMAVDASVSEAPLATRSKI